METDIFRTINIEELALGMYVNKVCAQSGNVSIKSKGIVKSPNVIDQLVKKGVLSVEIDISRSAPNTDFDTSSSVNNAEDNDGDEKYIQKLDADGNPVYYPPVNFDSCQRLYSEAFLLQRSLKHDLLKSSKCDIRPIDSLIKHVCHSLTLNSDAMVALTLLRNKKDFLFQQGMNNAILAVRFALQLSLPEEEVVELGIAALLMDIGMTHVSDNIINKPSRLSHSQRAIVEEHVDMSVKLLALFEELPLPNIKRFIVEHHERLDGSGYPNQLTGDDISQGAQILALVDSFNAMTNYRPYREVMTANSALSSLLTDSKKYSSQLVQSFIKTMGIHPIGSLVKLASGKLAIIIRQNDTLLMEPVVIAFYSVSAKHPIAAQRIDLSLKTDTIESAVHPSEHNINIQQFLLEYLVPNVF